VTVRERCFPLAEGPALFLPTKTELQIHQRLAIEAGGGHFRRNFAE